jgi:hypothetical protein
MSEMHSSPGRGYADMSEMVERATAAAIEVIIEAGGTIDFRVQPAIRAAIAAMREPTDRMLDIGEDEYVETDLLKSAWQAMIDAALTEQPI